MCSWLQVLFWFKLLSPICCKLANLFFSLAIMLFLSLLFVVRCPRGARALSLAIDLSLPFVKPFYLYGHRYLYVLGVEAFSPMHWNSLSFFLVLRLSLFLLGIEVICLLCYNTSGGACTLPSTISPLLFVAITLSLCSLLQCILGVCLYLPFVESPSLSLMLKLYWISLFSLSLALKLFFSPFVESPFLSLSLTLKLYQISFFLSP